MQMKPCGKGGTRPKYGTSMRVKRRAFYFKNEACYMPAVDAG
jgi:hypothetical protein